MDYIQTEEIYRRLLKLCKEADTKNIHMLEFPVFLTLLSKVDVVMEDSDHEYFQNKFLLKNGKIVYEEAIKDLSIGVKLSKTNLMKESKRYLDQIEDQQVRQSKDADTMTQNIVDQNNPQSIGIQSSENQQKIESENNANLGKVQSNIQMLVTLMVRDQVEKEMANALKTAFLACSYTEEGFADREEFETKLKSMNMLVSAKSLDKLFSIITSK